MGTVGVLSYLPAATNATTPIAASSSTSAGSAQASASAAATPSRTANTAASKARALTTKNRTTKRPSGSATATTPSGTSSMTRRIVGSTIQTQFGPVQVQISVQGTKIISATALQTPQGGRSSQINQQAVPYLVQETLAAQSANIQGVSGATYTSDAWVQSLQSALSKI